MYFPDMIASSYLARAKIIFLHFQGTRQCVHQYSPIISEVGTLYSQQIRSLVIRYGPVLIPLRGAFPFGTRLKIPLAEKGLCLVWVGTTSVKPPVAPHLSSKGEREGTRESG